MNKLIYLIFIFFLSTKLYAKDDIMILKLKYGEVKIKLFSEIAPNHVERFKTLSNSNQYNGVVFHRVIEGFMAQTGDVEFGNSLNDKYDLHRVGSGESNLPNLKAEFSNVAHVRGILSMARSADPNSANSQFFICLADSPHLDREYTAFGKVIEGMEHVDKIKKGSDPNGSVREPDEIVSLKSSE